MKKLIILLIFIGFTSCVSTRVNQFAEFAHAGRQYARAMEILTTEAGILAIETDSEELLDGRDLLSEEERSHQYVEHSEILKELLGILNDIREHIRLLERYFTSLGELANTEAPERISTELESVVNSLMKIRPRLEKGVIGKASVNTFIGTSVPPLLSGIRQQALEQELQRHGKVIERELELQSALLKALSQQMSENLQYLQTLKESQAVAIPYMKAASLGEPWKVRRKEIFTAYFTLDAVKKAEFAGESLRKCYLDLLEKRFGYENLTTLLTDIHAMVNLVDIIKTSKEPK